MRLGTETGSVINHLMARGTRGEPEPTVGMGATLLSWTDRHAGTIVAVEKDGAGRYVVTVREDKARVVSGSTFDGSAAYEYEPDPDGFEHMFRREEGKGWRGVRRGVGRRLKLAEGYGLRIGARESYRDPSF